MLQEAKRDADVEKVCRVFGDYIKASPMGEIYIE